MTYDLWSNSQGACWGEDTAVPTLIGGVYAHYTSTAAFSQPR